MGGSGLIHRRQFLKLCTSALACLGGARAALPAEGAQPHSYARVLLVDPAGKPLSPEGLRVDEAYVFHYPFRSTPCFLIDLGESARKGLSLETEAGEPYPSPGGVGPRGSVVAFSAICAHRMSYPTATVSFIDYRHREQDFTDSAGTTTRRSRVIYCCSERSVYDPLAGGRVLGGPAPQPLAAILLEYDPEGPALYATGTLGGEMFRRFFREFGFRLALDRRSEDYAEPVEGTTTVVPIEEYSRNRISC